MPHSPIGLWIGDRMIGDLFSAQPEEIDWKAVEANMTTIKRFSGDPRALDLWTHKSLVGIIGSVLGASTDVVSWCHYHDHHEGVLGDWVGPVKNAIRKHTDILARLEQRIDHCVASHYGIPHLTSAIGDQVYVYDKMAEGIEWVFALNHPRERWPLFETHWMGDCGYTDDELQGFLHAARGMAERTWPV